MADSAGDTGLKQEITGNQHVIQFLLFAKDSSGCSASSVAVKATEAPGVYVFSELMATDSISDLKVSDPPMYKLLELYAYGCLQDYFSMKDSENLPELSDKQLTKLRLLTIAKLARNQQYIDYQTLLEQLRLSNLRQLEDLLIEAIYSGVLSGKLDQRNLRLEVYSSLNRDVRPTELAGVIATLESWSQDCEALLGTLDSHTTSASHYKLCHAERRRALEADVEEFKRSLKAASQEVDQASVDMIDLHKKGCKSKLTKSSRAFWNKS